MTKEQKFALPPSALVLDLVFGYTTQMGQPQTACIHDDIVILMGKNHQGKNFMLTAKFYLDGDASEEGPRFVMVKLGPTVWKLSPSIMHESVHAYVTVVGVPDPAPWEAKP